MSNDHFEILNNAIAPQPWMQYRHVASADVDSVAKSYTVVGGGNKDEQLQYVVAKWTNNTPTNQAVYSVVTRGGALVSLQARSRGYLQTNHGVDIDTDDTPSFDLIETSKFGIGGDFGVGGLLGIGTGFAVSTVYNPGGSAPHMPKSVGMNVVAPGETFFAAVEVRFVTDFWENTSIDGGSEGTESRVVTGETQIDIYALPSIVPPTPRPTPTIIGIESDIADTFSTSVDVPAGTAEGDVILAVVFNSFGLLSDIFAGQTGWTLLTTADAGWEDSHLKVYGRVATDSEPAHYTFANGLLAEETAHLVAIRDASTDFEDGWYFASALRKYWWERDSGHGCPTIDRAGKLLICFSYVPYNFTQPAMSQLSPTGMTEISDVHGATTCTAVAYLEDPPRPTQERQFVTSATPQWTWRAIALSVLVPGAQV